MVQTNYDLNDIALLEATFTVDGVATDPTVVELRIRRPDGSLQILNVGGGVVKDSTGVYHADVTVDQPGNWTYRFTGTGTAVDNEQGFFYVIPDLTAADPAGHDLCTLRDVYRYVPGFDPEDIENADIVATLANLISAESAAIRGETGREIGTPDANTTRTFGFDSYDKTSRTLAVGDATYVSSIEVFDVDGTTSLGVVASSGWYTQPYVREDWEPLTSIVFRDSTDLPFTDGGVIQVTGIWGFPQVPADLREACAKRVVLRYIADIGFANQLSQAIEDTFSVGGLIRSSQDVVRRYRHSWVA